MQALQACEPAEALGDLVQRVAGPYHDGFQVREPGQVRDPHGMQPEVTEMLAEVEEEKAGKKAWEGLQSASCKLVAASKIQPRGIIPKGFAEGV